MSARQTNSNQKIRVRFGKLYLSIYDSASKKLVQKYKITKITEVAPIVVLCENFDYYIRGFGILIKTENDKYYTFQLISHYNYTDPEDVLRLYNFRAIVNYRRYVEILGLIRGWKIVGDSYGRLIFANGSKLIGSGLVARDIEDWYDGIVPIYVYYPNGLEKEIRYPKRLQVVPSIPKYEFELHIEPNKELVEVENVIIPGFALI